MLKLRLTDDYDDGNYPVTGISDSGNDDSDGTGLDLDQPSMARTKGKVFGRVIPHSWPVMGVLPLLGSSLC